MILQNLSCIKKKPNQPLEQHLKRFDELISQHTSSTNKAIEPMYKNTFLLTSLSDCPEYKQTITSLMTTTTELNYETIIQKLKVTEEQLSRERKDNKNQAFMISQNDQRETMMMIILDIHSMIYFIRNKHEVFQKFKEYKTLIENQTNFRIKNLMSDNGGEYKNRNFEDYCKENGILQNFAVAYNPQSNGVAERLNRTLLNMTRAQLIEAYLNPVFWAEAIMTSNYIKNRLPTKITGMSPYQKLFNKIPSANHLKVFGCVVFANIDNKTNINKLDSRAQPYLFMGYNRPSCGYRLFDFRVNACINARNCTFLDDKFCIDINDKNILRYCINLRNKLVLDSLDENNKIEKETENGRLHIQGGTNNSPLDDTSRNRFIRANNQEEEEEENIQSNIEIFIPSDNRVTEANRRENTNIEANRR